MIRYHRLGTVPDKKHVQFRNTDGSLRPEQLFSTRGFDGPMSTLYHLGQPTEVVAWSDLGSVKVQYLEDEPLRHRHLKTLRMPAHSDFVFGRVPLMGNSSVVWNQVVMEEGLHEDLFYKNAEHDEILFCHDGPATLRSMFGTLEVRPLDYVVVPRGTIWRIDHASYPARLLVIESAGGVTTPKRYRNEYGQMLEHAPFSERDFRAPEKLETIDDEGEFRVVVKARDRHTLYKYRTHPFDVVGWDGFVWPVAFNIMDFAPIVGKLHMPPPIHQTFAAPGFVVCSFCPRMLDFHPDAVVVPYVHSNVDSDEILYYCNDKFGSRKGIEEGSITIHPLGIPHGPQPGAVEGSIGAKETRELAVMLDTFGPLKLTENAISLEDGDYWKSWQLPS